MAGTPKRPITYRFVIGKGLAKRRRESENTARAVVEQVTLAFADAEWTVIRDRLKEAIEKDVEAELTHTIRDFRRNVIGAPAAQRGLVGTLTTVSKGGTPPTQSLGSLPRWAPRGARYLDEKKVFAGHKKWFDNTGWEPDGGTLKTFFESDDAGTTSMKTGSAGIITDMFGGITVDIVRNNRAWGSNQGTVQVGSSGVHMKMQLATVRVRALGAVTEAMMRISEVSNTALLDEIKKEDPIVALHLRGGRGRYRPTLEPYLRFFLERALPHAVQQRIAKGTAAGRLFRQT